MAKPIVPILIGVGLIAAFAMMSKKAGAAEKVKTDDKGGPPPPDYLPGTKTLKSSVRVIDKSTPTPSHFALKYSGDDKRWRELIEANPEGAIYPGSPAIKTAYPVLDSDGTPTGVWTTIDNGAPAAVQSLLPWAWDQKVVLPSSWL